MEMVINDNIKIEREKRGWSLQELSQALKARGVIITASTLQRYETGEIKNIPYKSVIALAETFSMSPATLMGWSAPEIETVDSISLQYMKYHEALKSKLEQDHLMELVKIFTNLPEEERENILSVARKKDSAEKAKKAAALQAQIRALEEELAAITFDD